MQGFRGASGGLLLLPDGGDDVPGLAGVVRGDVADVGGAGHQAVGDRVVGERADQGLALRRAGVMEGPLTLKCRPSKWMWCSLSRSMKRPVATSRISASSSQLSQSRRSTST